MSKSHKLLAHTNQLMSQSQHSGPLVSGLSPSSQLVALRRLVTQRFPRLYVCLHTFPSMTFEPESFNGHIEYKRTLANCSERRIQEYATQMQWRIMENIKHQYAIYYIGIDDDGTIIGLDTDSIISSIEHFIEIAQSISASLTGINLIEIVGDDSVLPRLIILKIGVKIKKQAEICPILC